MSRVVLDAVAVAKFTYHGDVLACAALDPFCLEYFARIAQLLETVTQFTLDITKRRIDDIFWCHVVTCGEKCELLHLLTDDASNRIEHFYPRDERPCQVDPIYDTLRCRHHLHSAPEGTERAGREVARDALKVH